MSQNNDKEACREWGSLFRGLMLIEGIGTCERLPTGAPVGAGGVNKSTVHRLLQGFNPADM